MIVLEVNLLTQKYRLKSKSDFSKIYRYGHSKANSYLVLYFFPQGKKTAAIGNPRIGFSVSKKLGNAVVRNKIKRRMRAAIKPYLQLIRSDVDIIFIARKKIKGISFSDVEKNMICLLKKAGLLEQTNSSNRQSSDV